MFKKNPPKTPKSPAPAHENTATTLKSWLTGKLGSFLLLSATGYALYKFGIITKITNYFKQDKGKGKASSSHSTFTTDN